MPIPSETIMFPQSIDPSDLDLFVIDLTGMLRSGETIISHTLETMAETTLLGGSQGVGIYSTIRTGNLIAFYPTITNPELAAFDTEKLMPFKVTFTTDASPPRRKQFTAAVRVVQK